MFEWGPLLQPDLVLGDSILGLTPDIIRQHQLSGLILDVDETLVPFRQSDPMADVKQWADRVKASVAIVLVSNNLNQVRIRRIATALDVPYFTAAGKPSRRKLRQAAAILDRPPHQIGMVGDRLFTDVLAGNRIGMFTILVDPMVDPLAANPKKCVRNFEIWLSARLGVTLKALS
ncbi:MAG: YqeG family HAD IIIA-type phosphatase [Leptolyngbya sp. SIO4C1]|nr:YqeG family HAD IIIA-type phosphatase [Leptolyngbya sp. SIO4C1]